MDCTIPGLSDDESGSRPLRQTEEYAEGDEVVVNVGTGRARQQRYPDTGALLRPADSGEELFGHGVRRGRSAVTHDTPGSGC
jgi:hypothetical protein